MSEAPDILPPQANLLALHQAPQAMINADSDETLIRPWLHGRPKTTQAVYERDSAAMLDYVGKQLRRIVLEDLQAYQASLTDLAPATQARKLKTVKSLFTFGQKTGYLTYNIGAAIFLPKVKNTLAERILSEEDVLLMLRMEKHPRNKVILRLLYLGGLRISELCDLRVRDMAKSADSGQVTIFGKGGKTRAVLLKDSMWEMLVTHVEGKHADDPVFASRQQNRPLGVNMVHRIVKKAAARAELSDNVSSHWLRHGHVSHALDANAPIHLIQKTVGHASLATTSTYAHAKSSDSSSRYLKG